MFLFLTVAFLYHIYRSRYEQFYDIDNRHSLFIQVNIDISKLYVIDCYPIVINIVAIIHREMQGRDKHRNQ